METFGQFNKFIILPNRDGKRPWSHLTHLLSGRMRTWRHNQKFKYAQSSASVGAARPGGPEVSDSDRSSLSSRSRSPTPRNLDMGDEGVINNISKEEYATLMERCRKMCDQKCTKRGDVKSVIKKTFASRREDIKKMNRDEMPMISSVIEDWPCFQFGDFVSI